MTSPGFLDGIDAEGIRSCCASAYSSDLVRLLLGDSYHPGGLASSRRLLDALDIAPGGRVVDVASGTGATALLAAAEYDLTVDGVDLAAANVAIASSAAAARGMSRRVRFHQADAERLPLQHEVADAVICECSLCTFPGKSSAVAEMARVLRRGGRVGIADVTADRSRLPDTLTGLVAWAACVADARRAEDYVELLEAHDLRVRAVSEHPRAAGRMVAQLSARVELLRMTKRRRAGYLGIDFDRVHEVLSAAEGAVAAGALGYVLIVADKP